MARSSIPKEAIFWPVVVAVVTIDQVTKLAAADSLIPRGVPHAVWGDWLRLTLVYNPGAAFGLNLGPQSRWIFLALTLGALVILWRLFRATAPGDLARTIAVSLVCGGAVGNLIDRVRSPMGVVDFLDVGIREMRWPTFNVADMAVSTGAFLLAWVLWGEEQPEDAAAKPPDASGEAQSESARSDAASA